MTPAELIYLAWLAALTVFVGKVALVLHEWDGRRTVVEVELWLAMNALAVRGLLHRVDRRLRALTFALERDALRRAGTRG